MSGISQGKVLSYAVRQGYSLSGGECMSETISSAGQGKTQEQLEEIERVVREAEEKSSVEKSEPETPPRRATVVSFINYKGGVGKTTTTFHIGCALAAFHGMRVLLVDDDPQTNLTFLCADFDSWRRQVDSAGSIESLYRAFVEETHVPIRQIIWNRPMADRWLANVDLIPSNVTLLDIDLRLQSRTRPSTTIQEVAETHLSQRSILLNGLSEVAHEYDYVLIDCPPNLYLATQNALYASDGYLITLMPDYFSRIGARFLDDRVRQLLRERSLAEQILGQTPDQRPDPASFLSFVKVNVTAGKMQIEAREQMNYVRTDARFASRCFDSITEDYKDIREAADEHRPVFFNSPGSHNDRNYRRMTEEFLRRFPHATSSQQGVVGQP